jgi:perosamine synthetase
LNNQSIISFIKSNYPQKDIIHLHEPLFIGKEKEYLIDAIDSTFVSSTGEYVNRFEKMMTEITGAKYAVAIVNGTSALHLALLCAGVKANDLVITQSLSFIATTNAISYIGAQPVFLDVDIQTMGLCPKTLEKWLRNETITQFDSENQKMACFYKKTMQKVSAIVPMHTFGHPCQIEEIKSISEAYHIVLLEDSAESIGSYYNHQHTGTFGLAGVFSFNGNKTVTCGGGGAITTNDEVFAKKAKHLSTQAKMPHRWAFNHDQIGYNYRMPNLNAALACAQLENLNEYVANKRALAQSYIEYFAKDNTIQFKKEPIHSNSNYWLNTIQFENLEKRNEFLEESNQEGIFTRPTWTPTHLLPMYKNAICGDLDNTVFLADRLVNIPSSVRL